MIAYKLFTVRKDGTLGPLFINRSQRIPVGVWLTAEDHPTNGFAHRPGWHATLKPVAPHLDENPKTRPARRWFKIEISGARTFERPESQGGTWVLGDAIKVIGPA